MRKTQDEKQIVISFPHMGNYHVPIALFLRLVFPNCTVITAPKITRRTLELGSKHSPDFVCVPFKYNLGNYIEALEQGANVLIQAGGGCRYGYYVEIQEQILRDLGYEFTIVKLLGSTVNPLALYKIVKGIGSPLPLPAFLYILALALRAIAHMDRFEAYMRENMGFERAAGSFERLHAEFLGAIRSVRSFRALSGMARSYCKRLRSLAVSKPEGCLKVGVVGELYTLMEPFCNCFIERELAKCGIQVSRYITVTFLLFGRYIRHKRILKAAGKYLKYPIGADGTDSVERGKALAERGYDGIIHIKPFGCMPEVNAMPMLQNISRDYKIPILYLSFDAQTSETGVKTRLEAFEDMMLMRKGQF